MGEKTTIEWTRINDNAGSTWNPIAAFLRCDIEVKVGGETKIIPKGTRGWFCTKVSPGCAGCYAEGINVRLGNGLLFIPGNLDKIEWGPVSLDAPLKWKRPRLIFTDSMDDFFHEAKPDRLIDQVFAVMALADRHIFQVLTKRSARARQYLSDPRTPGRIAAALVNDYAWTKRSSLWKIPVLTKLVNDLESGAAWPLKNVAIGASAENQAFADSRIPELIQTPAAWRFVSYEPALGPIDFGKWLPHEYSFPSPGGEDCSHCGVFTNVLHHPFAQSEIDLIIAGGESGLRARPSHPDWFRFVRDQCVAAGVAFLFKQWGEWLHLSQSYDLRAEQSWIGRYSTHKWPDGTYSLRVGKKRAGRLLDGEEWHQMPAAWIKCFEKADAGGQK